MSSKAEGNNFGINWTRSGNKSAPPGSAKIANEGTVLQISSNCSLTFSFSSSLSSLTVDLESNSNSSLPSISSFVNLF